VYKAWFYAPNQRTQKMGAFILLNPDSAVSACKAAMRYTHNDKYKPIPGRKVMSTAGIGRLAVSELVGLPNGPEYAQAFKNAGVDIVLVNEFHSDGHPRDSGNQRLKELEAMFAACRKYSDSKITLFPCEEYNEWIPGHYYYLFAHPVYFTKARKVAERASHEEVQPYGKVYRIGSTGQWYDLIKKEGGILWGSHLRTKNSSMAPDAYKDQEYFRSDCWLGGDWKPTRFSDLSQDSIRGPSSSAVDDMNTWADAQDSIRGPSSGAVDDMNTWADGKYIVGSLNSWEVRPIFDIYAFNAVTYLSLASQPQWDNATEVIKALKSGDHFVTTGEILIHTIELENAVLKVDLDWTFPLDYVRLITYDGTSLTKKKVELRCDGEMERRVFDIPVSSPGFKWVRIEVADIAMNLAHSQVIYRTPR
jgi:hypothetical protein